MEENRKIRAKIKKTDKKLTSSLIKAARKNVKSAEKIEKKASSCRRKLIRQLGIECDSQYSTLCQNFTHADEVADKIRNLEEKTVTLSLQRCEAEAVLAREENRNEVNS